MIPPVPSFGERAPGTALGQQDPANPGTEGGFGELLDALAHGWGQPGPEVVKLVPADLPLAEAPPVTPAEAPPSWDERAHAPEASVFNQHGYFASGAAHGEAGPVMPASESVAPMDPRAQDHAEPTALRRADAAPAPAGGSTAAGTNGPTFAPAPAALPRAMASRAPAATAPAAIATQAAPGRAEPAAEEASASPSRRFTRLLEQRAASPSGGTSMVEVVLREVEQGMVVAGRVAALDPRERARLHDEIAGLLARHGLAARAIQISARTASGPGSQGRT